VSGFLLWSMSVSSQTYGMGKRGPRPKNEEIIWSSNLAYGVGLMATDGCLSPDGRHLLLTSKDREQLENLKAIFNVKANIGIVRSGTSISFREYERLQWGDVQLYNFLLSIGLTPNKSLTLGEVKVSDEYFFDFLRGLHDGDGCFYSYFDPRWKSSYMFYLCFTSASKAHLDWLRSTLGRLLGVKGSLSSHLQQNRRNSLYNLKFAKAETLKILEKMYPHPKVVSLTRKRLKIEEALRIVGEYLPS